MFKTVKEDARKLALLLLIVVIVLKLVFFRESLLAIVRIAASMFWMFILPGYLLTGYWNLSFFERILIGSGLSAALLGIVSYYAGLLGLDVNAHAYVLPLLLVALGFAVVKLSSAENSAGSRQQPGQGH